MRRLALSLVALTIAVLVGLGGPVGERALSGSAVMATHLRDGIERNVQPNRSDIDPLALTEADVRVAPFDGGSHGGRSAYDHRPDFGRAPPAPDPAYLYDASLNFSDPAAEGGRVLSVSSRIGVERVAPNSSNDFVNLASADRTRHILDGEVRPNGSFGGGHRPGTGFPKKSEFPPHWSDWQLSAGVPACAGVCRS